LSSQGSDLYFHLADMSSPDKKTNHEEMVERSSICESRTEYQRHHHSHIDDEPIKNGLPSAGPQDPFMGEEGTQVQYRSMKWWWVLST
jgi:hypothetical protein